MFLQLCTQVHFKTFFFKNKKNQKPHPENVKKKKYCFLFIYPLNEGPEKWANKEFGSQEFINFSSMLCMLLGRTFKKLRRPKNKTKNHMRKCPLKEFLFCSSRERTGPPTQNFALCDLKASHTTLEIGYFPKTPVSSSEVIAGKHFPDCVLDT